MYWLTNVSNTSARGTLTEGRLPYNWGDWVIWSTTAGKGGELSSPRLQELRQVEQRLEPRTPWLQNGPLNYFVSTIACFCESALSFCCHLSCNLFVAVACFYLHCILITKWFCIINQGALFSSIDLPWVTTSDTSCPHHDAATTMKGYFVQGDVRS